jgi:DNA (cytosine-5)-methyltransferase 1
VKLTSIEICAGAGGQAIGLEEAGFDHRALIENDRDACTTLRINRPAWNTLQLDVTKWDASEHEGVHLFAGGVPCPPFSMAGKRLGKADERDLFPAALERIAECKPQAVLLENVRGLLGSVFDPYREELAGRLREHGLLVHDWRLVHASDFGVPQLRPRSVMVALREDAFPHFRWPETKLVPPTVGEVLGPEMRRLGWKGAEAWSLRANEIAPTLVGGSKKHGGPDLGPTRAKKAWSALGVNAHLVANDPPSADFEGDPCLTVGMAALLQGFPPEWTFAGTKTSAYRQVGNAFPPPVARGVGLQIAIALKAAAQGQRRDPARFVPDYEFAPPRLSAA